MKYVSFLWMTLFLSLAQAQNLVPNGSFENMDPYTGNIKINCVSDWRNYTAMANPALKTPDLCFNINASFPMMSILPYDGSQYVAMNCSEENPEYIEVRLNSPMVAGAIYCVSFYTSAFDRWNTFTTLGAYFSTTPVMVNPFLAGFTSHTHSPVIADPLVWQRISDTYTATGGEEYMTIGSFEHTNLLMAYTYIDLVDVHRIEPVLELGEEKQICFAENLTLDAGADGSAYIWSTGETTSSIIVSAPGTYSVEKFYGACSFFDEVLVFSKGCEDPWTGTLFMPNAFTPNGDGLNDLFGAKAENIDEYQLEIFNRWGEKIFASTDLIQQWDGTYAETFSPEGIYIYNLSYNNGIKDVYHTGHIMLIR